MLKATYYDAAEQCDAAPIAPGTAANDLVVRNDRFVMFVTGLGIGIAGALLLAPQSGAELRSRLRGGADQTKDYLKERVGALSQTVGDTVAQGKQGLSNTLARGRDSMSDLRDKVKEKVRDAADVAEKAGDKVVGKSKDLAHDAGRKMEEGGKRLQQV